MERQRVTRESPRAVPPTPPATGSKLVVFNANDATSGGALSQTFATIPGERYGLAFDLGAVEAIADQQVRVKLQGSSVLVDEVIAFAAPGVGPFYVPQHRSSWRTARPPR